MLTLRKKDTAAFSEVVQKGRVPRIAAYLRRRFRHHFKAGDTEKVRGIVERADDAAARYGIVDEGDVALFADLCVMYGEDFHEQPWAREVLTSDALTSRDKVLELRDRVFRSGALM